MKISIDGGALCASNNSRFGNFTVTKNIIDAVRRYDKKNEYFIYTFCEKEKWLNTSEKIHYQCLKPRSMWLSSRVSWEEIVNKKDIFLALNQAVPLIVRSNIISISHGLSFYFYRDLYSDSYYALEAELKPMITKSKYVVVSSWRVKKELLKIFPKSNNIITIPYGIPYDMSDYQEAPRQKYFLYVGMDHPIKNIPLLLRAFRELIKDKKFHDYKLYLVGNLKNYEDKINNIYVFDTRTRSFLRKLYSEATAYITTSWYESFNIPILEALAQRCPVIGLKSAIIPEFNRYTIRVANVTELISQMKEVASGYKIDFEINEIERFFSWEKYINKLKQLYA